MHVDNSMLVPPPDRMQELPLSLRQSAVGKLSFSAERPGGGAVRRRRALSRQYSRRLISRRVLRCMLADSPIFATLYLS
jgi:hypothetical protein